MPTNWTLNKLPAGWTQWHMGRAGRQTVAAGQNDVMRDGRHTAESPIETEVEVAGGLSGEWADLQPAWLAVWWSTMSLSEHEHCGCAEKEVAGLMRKALLKGVHGDCHIEL
ncbi:unnamed protein product [Ostreobium quekettii]|uniref:Uncharacterized protein n=1 Tax=Ostreobium quekettii TaxID=121088 RepID=A0A8S1J2G6_9CHLO|nr:unnamed protein product [Ostreobium quekettii]